MEYRRWKLVYIPVTSFCNCTNDFPMHELWDLTVREDMLKQPSLKYLQTNLTKIK